MVTHYEHLYIWADEPERIHRRVFSTPPAARGNRRAQAAARHRLEEAIADARQAFDDGEVLWFRIAIWKGSAGRRGEVLYEVGTRPHAVEERPVAPAR